MASSSSDDDEVLQSYYYGKNCESCRRMEKTEMKEEHDDGDFVDDDDERDDFRGDEKLRLRVIHYRRKIWLSGCFDVDCPPKFGGKSEQVLSGKHYAGSEMFELTVRDCARLAVETYNEAKEGEELELFDVDKVAVQGCGWRNFFITMRCNDVGKRVKNLAGESADSEKTYRVLVSCCYWKKERKQMLIFRDLDEMWSRIVPVKCGWSFGWCFKDSRSWQVVIVLPYVIVCETSEFGVKTSQVSTMFCGMYDALAL